MEPGARPAEPSISIGEVETTPTAAGEARAPRPPAARPAGAAARPAARPPAAPPVRPGAIATPAKAGSATTPAAKTTPDPAPSETRPAAKESCNPPYYFEGTKKIFKPACL